MRTLLAALLVVSAATACKKDKKHDVKAEPQAATPDAAAAQPKTAAPDAAAAQPVASIDAAPAQPDDPNTAVLAALAEAAKCKEPDSPMRVWCIAAEGWAGAAAAPLPAGAATLAGLTVELMDGAPVDAALSEKVSVSALSLKQDGGKQLAKLTNITPSSDEEAKTMAEIVFNLAALYKGKADVAELPKDLADYLASLADGADREVTAAGAGWTWSGDSSAELRKVGDYWVAIEVPAEKNGRWVSIFTDKIKAK